MPLTTTVVYQVLEDVELLYLPSDVRTSSALTTSVAPE